MSTDAKPEDDNSVESEESLEVMRSSAGPPQTYRPHKRAPNSDNSQQSKQPRLDTGTDAESNVDDSNHTPEHSQSLVSEPDDNRQNSGSASAQTSSQVDPEIIVISDTDDDDDDLETELINPFATQNQQHLQNQQPQQNQGNQHEQQDEPLPPVHSISEFMRQVARLNGDPEAFERTRLTPQQRHIWLRQQMDAENRRRRATADNQSSDVPTSRYIPFVAEAMQPGDESPNALYRIHIGPPVMQTIQSRLPRQLQEFQDRSRVCVAHSLLNRYTVLYPYRGANSENHEQKSCVVCITEFQDDQSVRRLPCMHIFHKECVDRWIVHSMKCPICRYSLLGNRTNNQSPPSSSSTS